MRHKVFYVYLDITNFLAAWSAYRGIMVSPRYALSPKLKSEFPYWAPISFCVAGLIRNNDFRKLNKELLIEKIRQKYYPSQISRLHGIYLWGDKESARKAESWRSAQGKHFDLAYLIDVCFTLEKPLTKVDTNWITEYLINDSAPYDPNNTYWIHEYWSGNPKPKMEPHWEYIVEGRGILWGNELRYKAYDLLKAECPNSLGILEYSRMIVDMDIRYNLYTEVSYGDLSPYLIPKSNNKFKLTYYTTLTKPEELDKNFNEKLKYYRDNIPPSEVNWQALKTFKTGQRVPDLRGMGCEFDASNVLLLDLNQLLGMIRPL
jgi:hypothetical protein